MAASSGLASVMGNARALRTGEGVYRVEDDGAAETVYVAGPQDAPWAFWNGHVYVAAAPTATRERRAGAGEGRQTLAAPMPATVRAVLVQPGAHVTKGETVVLLEAMKMELPIRAPADGVVTAIHCRAGELVQPDAVLVELE